MRAKGPLLRNHLLKWLLIPLFALLALDGTLSYWVALRYSEQAYDKSLVNIAHDISTHLSTAESRLILDLPQGARRVLFTDSEDQIYFGVTTAEGNLIAGRALPLVEFDAGEENASILLYNARINDELVRIARFIVTPERVPPSTGAIIYVAETKRTRNMLARKILLSVLAPQIVLILISALIVRTVVRRSLAPMNRLSEMVSSRSPANFSPIALSGIPGELCPLLQSINDLLERLEHALSAQSHFIADAAHQLKTPVAALQAQIELALREDDVATRTRDSMSRVLPSLDRIERMVSQLLSLARNEPHAGLTLSLVPLDLNALALETAASWIPEALRKNIDLGFEGKQAPLLVSGESGRLRELLDNLLDNALRYSREGGRVTLSISATPVPSFAVTDSAPRIPEDEKERIFERFYRHPDNTCEGSGLGLAIARSITQLHGARICVLPSNSGDGNTFEVTFPPFFPAGLSRAANPQSA